MPHTRDNRALHSSSAAILLLLTACAATTATQPAPITHSTILTSMEHMADAQIAQYKNNYPVGWVDASFYIGLARLSHVSSKDTYLKTERAIATQSAWDLKPTRTGVYFADNQCILQMYLDLAATDNTPDKLTNVKKNLDGFLTFVQSPPPARGWPGGGPIPWYWCDSMYMAPAALAQMSAATGDKKYLDEMDKQFWATNALLYDKDEHLYFRDKSFITPRSATGKKIFWARGNGWVAGGLTNILLAMPADYPSRPKYIALFKDFCEKLATLQQPDGLWRANLLEPDAFPSPETSGSTFFCYALAWGINNNILDRAKYLPIVDKAWEGLYSHRRPDGLIGYAQPVGAAPGPTKPDGTHPYAVGAYLLAGTEMLKLHK